MFKVWNIIDTGLHAGSTGHHYWETKALVEELLRRGIEVRVFCHTSTPKDRFPGAQVYPIFTLSLYLEVSRDPSWGTMENFVVHNRSFESDLSRGVARSVFHDSLCFFQNLSKTQMLGAIRWLGHFDDRLRPSSMFFLKPPDSEFAESACRTLWADCPPAVKTRVALAVRAPEVADLYDRLFGVKPRVLPSLLGAVERRDQIAANAGTLPPRPMTVSFVAGARRERGPTLIPDVARLCATLDVRFFVQVKREGEPDVDRYLLEALRGLPNVDLHEGMLERDAYHDVIARSVVLIPYPPKYYQRKSQYHQLRSSGVYQEAKFLGAPVIVHADSRIAAEVRSLGNGLMYEEHTPAGIAASIAGAQGEIGHLRERAARCARDFSANNGPDRFVDAIGSLFAGNPGAQ